MPMVFLSYEIAYHMCDNNTCCFGCNVILIGFSFFFPVFSKAKNKLLSFVSMCLQHSNSDITGISVVRETTRYQSDVSNSQAHVNTEEFNLSWNLHCRYVVHALSSYKDHPYKDQVVHFQKNKDQY